SILFFSPSLDPPALHSFPTRRSSDLLAASQLDGGLRLREAPLRRPRPSLSSPARGAGDPRAGGHAAALPDAPGPRRDRHVLGRRSEEHTSELQSLAYLVCRLLLEKKN